MTETSRANPKKAHVILMMAETNHRQRMSHPLMTRQWMIHPLMTRQRMIQMQETTPSSSKRDSVVGSEGRQNSEYGVSVLRPDARGRIDSL